MPYGRPIGEFWTHCPNTLPDRPVKTTSEMFFHDIIILQKMAAETWYPVDSDYLGLAYDIDGKISACSWEELRNLVMAIPYQEFLKTVLWICTNSFILREADYRCQRCGVEEDKEHLQAHHLTHFHLGSELYFYEDLICLCDTCHKAAHNFELEYPNWR
jgi:hypothetical protein